VDIYRDPKFHVSKFTQKTPPSLTPQRSWTMGRGRGRTGVEETKISTIRPYSVELHASILLDCVNLSCFIVWTYPFWLYEPIRFDCMNPSCLIVWSYPVWLNKLTYPVWLCEPILFDFVNISCFVVCRPTMNLSCLIVWTFAVWLYEPILFDCVKLSFLIVRPYLV